MNVRILGASETAISAAGGVRDGLRSPARRASWLRLRGSWDVEIYISTIYVRAFISGWWFQTWLLLFHILGISSSQLTFIFFRGIETTNQICMSPFEIFPVTGCR